jgi:hypothetical protein
MRAAWKVTDADEGMKRLEGLARFLEHDYESAARSVREEMAEMFKIQKLKLPPSLYKCLGATNVIESPQSGIQKRTSNVTRWRNGERSNAGLPQHFYSPRSIFERSSVIGTSGLSPLISGENKTPQFSGKLRNMDLPAASTFNLRRDILLSGGLARLARNLKAHAAQRERIDDLVNHHSANRPPRLVWVKSFYGRRGRIRGRAKILLVNDTVLVYEKGLNARRAVFGRPRHQAKAANHRAVLDIVQGPASRLGPLSQEDPEVITVIGGRSLAFLAISL